MSRIVDAKSTQTFTVLKKSTHLQRAYHSVSVSNFLQATNEQVLGALSARSEFSIETTQRDAWVEELTVLRKALDMMNGHLFLEFIIPRIGSRVDAVLL